MTQRLADRLSAARRGRFIGRDGDLAVFRAALTAPELPFSVLHVYGPGGIGKTTLLAEFLAICAREGVPAAPIDGRNVDPVPDMFLGALQLALQLPAEQPPLPAMAARPGRQVLLVDTYELLAPLDGWLRDVFLPQLPADVLVILAGRNPPALAWRADPGWQMLVQTLPLRNLTPDESRAYLASRAVPESEHRAVLDFTHGHPLALSLVADAFAQRPNGSFQPETAPDVIQTLLEQFVQKVPGPAHRAALEVCALVRLTTESLLSETLGMPDVHELFEWLRSLSFVEAGRHGLFPHDLAREALDADVRWRNPDWYVELHRRARAYYAGRLQQTQGRVQQGALLDYIFLHRHNPMVRPFYAWQESGNVLPDPAGPADRAAIAEIVARHEGQASARLAEHWFDRQPAGIVVFRDAPGTSKLPAGFMATIALDAAQPDDIAADPGARAAWEYLRGHLPLRPGESATMFRFWMARDTYQSVSPIQSLIGVTMVRHYMTTPGLAFTFFPCADPEFWAPLTAYMHLRRIRAAEFEVDGRRYGMYGHDWRALPPMAWLALMADQELASELSAAPRASSALVVLSQEAFASAVRAALHDLSRPDALRDNPLLRSRLVVDRAAGAGVAERISVLQSLLRDACESLQSSPRDTKLYRALYHAYLNPAPTQEQAAEALDLPFSTFRRHLKSGVTYVAELMWLWELQGANEHKMSSF